MMKKYISFLVILILVLCLSSVSLAADIETKAILNRNVSIVYNNELKEFSDVNGVKVYPLTYQGTTYLPIRAISALFSIPVDWNGTERIVLLGSGDVSKSTVKTISEFVTGDNEEVSLILSESISIQYNGVTQVFTDVNGTRVYPLNYRDTTYLPVRAISNMYGATVDWDGVNQRITLVKENKIASITDVIIKVIDGTLCTEIKTDLAVDNFSGYLLAEGTIAAEPHLNMRADTSTTSEILAKIPDETIVTISKVIKDKNLKTWYQVTYEEKAGFVSADYVNINSTRMFVDLENTKFATNTDSQKINYQIIDAVRFGNQGENINRVVLDLNTISEYTVVQSEDKLSTYIAFEDEFKIKEEVNKDYVLIASIGSQIFLPETDKKPTESGEIENNKTEENKSEENKREELTQEQINNLAKVTSVTYSSTTNKIKVNINGKYEFEKFMLENPTRLVVDISNALLDTGGVSEITPQNQNIKKIRFAQNKLDVVRVVVELNSAVDYDISKKAKVMEISIDAPEYKNVEYIAYNNYAELILKNAKKRIFDVTETQKTNKYTITYSSSKFDSGKADLEINDDFLKEITIRTNKIILKGTGEMAYEMKQDGSDVVIKISKRISDEDDDSEGKFVVLLDAGHGGADPGACHNGGKTEAEREKTYTLKVMLKVLDLLEGEDDIEVRTSRTTDVYIDRQGRIDYVLENPDANLLVSVHINSHSNSIHSGTLVLYYNKANEKEDYGITSKELATIVKDNMVEMTGLSDKGVVSRNDVWILEQNDAGKITASAGEERPVTNLPAILCELCFISNESDFAMLQTEEFQDAAAKAIFDGILEAKEQMEN